MKWIIVDEEQSVKIEQNGKAHQYVESGHPNARTYKMKVEGGYLYRTCVKTIGHEGQYGVNVALCFVPCEVKPEGSCPTCGEPNHEAMVELGNCAACGSII